MISLIRPKEDTLKTLYQQLDKGTKLAEDLKPLSEAVFVSTQSYFRKWSNFNDSLIEKLFSENTVLEKFYKNSKKNIVSPSVIGKRQDLYDEISKLQKKFFMKWKHCK